MSSPEGDGYIPSPDRNLVAEKRARLDRAAAGLSPRRRGRKSGDPREDRARAEARRAAQEGRI